jgi:uncharacterized pyridoxamine 5'-phosphate oxidase family protein
MNELQTEILSLFSDRQTIDLATCEGLQPRVRPMTLIFFQQRFFIATGSSDAKAAHIQNNPLAEIIYILRSETNSGYVRLSGTMKTITDQLVRKEIADFSGYIYNYWADSADPTFLLFELLPREAQLMLPGDMIAQNIIWETKY